MSRFPRRITHAEAGDIAGLVSTLIEAALVGDNEERREVLDLAKQRGLEIRYRRPSWRQAPTPEITA